MKDFIKQIAGRFADYPDELAVSRISGKNTEILELRCSTKDLGRIIGRSGRTINAIRTLLDAAASRENKKRVILEVVGRE